MKPRCCINPISHGWLLDKCFITSKGILAEKNERLKNMEIYPTPRFNISHEEKSHIPWLVVG